MEYTVSEKIQNAFDTIMSLPETEKSTAWRSISRMKRLIVFRRTSCSFFLWQPGFPGKQRRWWKRFRRPDLALEKTKKRQYTHNSVFLSGGFVK